MPRSSSKPPAPPEEEGDGETLSGGPDDRVPTPDDAPDLSETTDPADGRSAAPSATWWSRAIRRQDKKDSLADERVDRVYDKALAVAEASTLSAWRIVKFQWLVIGVLVLAVVGLAGYSVGFELPGFGEVSIGGKSGGAGGKAKKPPAVVADDELFGEVDEAPADDAQLDVEPEDGAAP